MREFLLLLPCEAYEIPGEAHTGNHTSRWEAKMIGTAVVLVLTGMVFPIAMLLLAILFDFLLVTWVLYHLWHDHWFPRLHLFARHNLAGLQVSLHPRRRVPRSAH